MDDLGDNDPDQRIPDAGSGDASSTSAVCPKCGEPVDGAEPGDVTSCADADGNIDRHVILVAPAVTRSGVSSQCSYDVAQCVLCSLATTDPEPRTTASLAVDARVDHAVARLVCRWLEAAELVRPDALGVELTTYWHLTGHGRYLARLALAAAGGSSTGAAADVAQRVLRALAAGQPARVARSLAAEVAISEQRAIQALSAMRLRGLVVSAHPADELTSWTIPASARSLTALVVAAAGGRDGEPPSPVNDVARHEPLRLFAVDDRDASLPDGAQ